MYQTSFLPDDPLELHKIFEKRFTRIDGEDWEEYQQFIIDEVNEHLKIKNANKPHPRYEDVENKDIDKYK